MADNSSPLELVPRGVEGTGKAVVLGNEPVVQSLARLSGRLDNLAKLKLYAQAKKTEAKEKKVEYDKTKFDVPGISSGIMTPVVQSIITPKVQNAAKNWYGLDPEQRSVEVGQIGALTNSGNNFITKTDADIKAEDTRLHDLGYNILPEQGEITRSAYIAETAAEVKKEAEAAGITDPKQVEFLTQQKILSNPNKVATTYRNVVENNPNYINLNRFGDRVLKSIGTTGRSVTDTEGRTFTVDRTNIYTPDGFLNKKLLKLSLSADDIDNKMFTLASRPYLSSAAQATGDKNAADATAKFISSGYNIDALDSNEQSLVANKVFPKAQDAVLSRMFSGKGMFETTQNVQTTEEKKRLEEKGVKQASTTTFRGPVNQYISYNSVTPSQYGETEVLGADKQPVVIDRGKFNLGNGITKTLPKDDKFQFNTGTRMYFIGAIPSTVKQQLGIRNQDGSYTTEMPFETQNLTLLTDEVYATNMNSKFTTEGGSVGYRPKGHIMPIGTPGAVPIGRNYAIVELSEYLKTMPENYRNKIQMDKEAIKGVKVVLSTDDNQQVLSKFEGELEPVNVPKRNSSITVAKNRK
jgi:hypothetical protein